MLRGDNLMQWVEFEKLHTLTLFYMAQCHGNLKDAKTVRDECRSWIAKHIKDHLCACSMMFSVGLCHYSQATTCLMQVLINTCVQSAQYCHRTLSRQLSLKDYEPGVCDVM